MRVRVGARVRVRVRIRVMARVRVGVWFKVGFEFGLPFTVFRTAQITCAPNFAKWNAASSPMPALAPVTIIVEARNAAALSGKVWITSSHVDHVPSVARIAFDVEFLLVAGWQR